MPIVVRSTPEREVVYAFAAQHHTFCRPARQHELIDAAIAVNEAPTLDDAFQVLADAGLGLLGADRLCVVVWNDDLSIGTVRAGAGTARARSARYRPTSTVLGARHTGGPSIGGPPVMDSLPANVLAGVEDMATVVRVPFVIETRPRHVPRVVESAARRRARPTEAAAPLQTLTRLTTIAERSLREREQEQFDHVLDGVADGVIVSSRDRVTPNAAARAILAHARGGRVRTSLTSTRASSTGRRTRSSPAAFPGSNAIESGESGRFRVRATALDGRELVLDGSVSPVGGPAR